MLGIPDNYSLRVGVVYAGSRQSDFKVVDGRLRDMFFDERLRGAVTFLVAEIGGATVNRWPVGTIFFICKSLDRSDEGETLGSPYRAGNKVIYAVTARHVLLDCQRDGYDPIYIRLNIADGGYIDVPTRFDDWIGHPVDGETDVCVYYIQGAHIDQYSGGKRVTITCMPFMMLATDEYIKSVPVNEGYEVFFLGLFSAHPGKQRPLPILRFGNISLLPHEKVDVYLSKEDEENGILNGIDAYLIEARSMGGVSGSPVLFYYPPLRDGEAVLPYFQLPIILGLVHAILRTFFERTRLAKKAKNWLNVSVQIHVQQLMAYDNCQ
jgi:hypothetical protein